jgi:hypothetical protein
MSTTKIKLIKMNSKSKPPSITPSSTITTTTTATPMSTITNISRNRTLLNKNNNQKLPPIDENKVSNGDNTINNNKNNNNMNHKQFIKSLSISTYGKRPPKPISVKSLNNKAQSVTSSVRSLPISFKKIIVKTKPQPPPPPPSLPRVIYKKTLKQHEDYIKQKLKQKQEETTPNNTNINKIKKKVETKRSKSNPNVTLTKKIDLKKKSTNEKGSSVMSKSSYQIPLPIKPEKPLKIEKKVNPIQITKSEVPKTTVPLSKKPKRLTKTKNTPKLSSTIKKVPKIDQKTAKNVDTIKKKAQKLTKPKHNQTTKATNSDIPKQQNKFSNIFPSNSRYIPNKIKFKRVETSSSSPLPVEDDSSSFISSRVTSSINLPFMSSSSSTQDDTDSNFSLQTLTSNLQLLNKMPSKQLKKMNADSKNSNYDHLLKLKQQYDKQRQLNQQQNDKIKALKAQYKLEKLKQQQQQPKVKEKEEGTNDFIELRRLGTNESIFHGDNPTSRSFILRASFISSVFDLYSNKGKQTLKGINEWKRLNPLLQARIITKTDPQTNKQIHHFVLPKQIEEDNDNIKLLRYENSSNKISNDLWKLILDLESTTTPNNTELQVPWKLTFLQHRDGQSLPNSKHTYFIILTYHHAIMDGKSSYMALLELFSILEGIYTKTYQSQKDSLKTILPSREDIFKNRTLGPIPESRLTKEYIQAPRFLDVDNAPATSYRRLKNITDDDEATGRLYQINNEDSLFITVKQLIEISKTLPTRLRTIIIKKVEFDKVVANCRLNNCKMTSFISLVVIKAMRMVSVLV